jgi:hypothetical protein
MKIRICPEKIAMVKHHRILVVVIDVKMNWNKHNQNANERTGYKPRSRPKDASEATYDYTINVEVW